MATPTEQPQLQATLANASTNMDVTQVRGDQKIMQRLAADALSASSATLLIAPSKSSPRFTEAKNLQGGMGEGLGEVEGKGKGEVLKVLKAFQVPQDLLQARRGIPRPANITLGRGEQEEDKQERWMATTSKGTEC
jgi:hypothetical protein